MEIRRWMRFEFWSIPKCTGQDKNPAVTTKKKME